MDTYEPEHPHLKLFGKKKKKKKQTPAVKKPEKKRRNAIKLVSEGGKLVFGGGDTKYLKSLDMKEDVKKMIMAKSFSIKGGYAKWSKTMESEIKTEIDKIPVSGEKWKACKSKCKASILKEYVKDEMESTAFVLRCMGEAILANAKKLEISLTGKKDDITGKWKKDHKLFKLVSWNQSKGRLIMGFGPSASGKTFWAENVVVILNKTINFPPGRWLSIDGGLYREVSKVYQVIVNAAHKHLGKKSGLTNLVKSGIKLPGLGGGSIFSSSKVKTHIYEWLKTQENKPNLYIPDTLGSSTGGWHKWRDLTKTKDSWIGLCIYMHKQGGEKCPFSKDFKCLGCEKKGKDRQASEGKQYSSMAYGTTYERGMKTAKKASKWMLIHNTGQKGKISTIQTNFSGREKGKLEGLSAKYNFRIVDDIVKTEKAEKTRARSSSKMCTIIEIKF